MSEIISSPSNPLIKQARALRQRKAREESGLFLVEGILHVGEALEAGWEFESLLYAPELLTSDFARALQRRVEKSGVRCAALSAAAFESFAEKENPQGLAALLRQRSLPLEDSALAGLRFGVALVSPQDPGNVGTIFRTLDAVGGQALFLLEGGVDVYHPSLVRASMGTLFWKPFFRLSFEEFSAWARRRGAELIGSSAHASRDYRSLEAASLPRILLLGSEQKGLSAQQIAACAETVALPMRGRATSLNLGVAASVLMYALTENQKPG
ncbi:MAG: RNA methyltransferase [Anaerolineales bacterium]